MKISLCINGFLWDLWQKKGGKRRCRKTLGGSCLKKAAKRRPRTPRGCPRRRLTEKAGFFRAGLDKFRFRGYNKSREASDFPACSHSRISGMTLSIFSMKIPYPAVGSLISTWVTAPMSLPFWMTGLPLTSVVK